MEYQASIIDLIRKRKSCRTFIKKEIEPGEVQKLDAFISDINSAIDIKARFMLVKRNITENNKPEKLGTYGFISGADSFIIGIISKEEKKVEFFGYNFEKIVLFATDLGLGTCWLGGFFKRSDFEKKINLLNDEFVPIVSPVGYCANKRNIMDSAVRAIARSGTRKSWDEIFFDTNPGSSLKKDSAGDYKVPLEMVRIAPSASNKQPWRIIRDNYGYNFYILRTKGYELRNYDIQRNDLGIAMCHFELALKELKLEGRWQIIKKSQPSIEFEYIATWIPDREVLQ